MLPWEYDRLDYWTIQHVYLAPHEKDSGELVPLRKRLGLMPEDTEELVGKPRPTIQELDIPKEAWLMGVPLGFIRMFWELWRSDQPGRRKTSAETLVLFKKKLWECPPPNSFQTTRTIVDTLDEDSEIIEPPGAPALVAVLEDDQ